MIFVFYIPVFALALFSNAFSEAQRPTSCPLVSNSDLSSVSDNVSVSWWIDCFIRKREVRPTTVFATTIIYDESDTFEDIEGSGEDGSGETYTGPDDNGKALEGCIGDNCCFNIDGPVSCESFSSSFNNAPLPTSAPLPTRCLLANSTGSKVLGSEFLWINCSENIATTMTTPAVTFDVSVTLEDNEDHGEDIGIVTTESPGSTAIQNNGIFLRQESNCANKSAKIGDNVTFYCNFFFDRSELCPTVTWTRNDTGTLYTFGFEFVLGRFSNFTTFDVHTDDCLKGEVETIGTALHIYNVSDDAFGVYHLTLIREVKVKIQLDLTQIFDDYADPDDNGITVEGCIGDYCCFNTDGSECKSFSSNSSAVPLPTRCLPTDNTGSKLLSPDYIWIDCSETKATTTRTPTVTYDVSVTLEDGDNDEGIRIVTTESPGSTDTTVPVLHCPTTTLLSSSSIVDFNNDVFTSDPDNDLISCNPSSGSRFADGIHDVNCIATDQVNNVDYCTFRIIIDTTVPVLHCPTTTLVSSSSIVDFNNDVFTSDPDNDLISCNPSSGSRFADGIHDVNCTATDRANNEDYCTFRIIIDTEGPNIACPLNKVWPSSEVTYNEAIATDNNNPHPTVTCSPSSGSTFLEGITNVVCIAWDNVNNTAHCNFNVTVDTTPPVIKCPKNIETQYQSPNWQEPMVTDATEIKSLNCTAKPNISYPIGSANQVRCTAEDSGQNIAECSFLIIIQTDLTEEISNITENVTNGNVEGVALKLEDITKTTDVLQPADIVQVSSALEDIVKINSTNENVTDAVIDTIDNIVGYLEDNSTVIIDTTASILNSLEQQVDTTASDGQNFTKHTDNLAVETKSLSTRALSSDVLFLVYENDINTCFELNCQKMTSDLSIRLPQAILTETNDTETRVSFMVLYNDALFPSETLKSSNLSTSGTILAATIHSEHPHDVLMEPVELVFSVPKNMSPVDESCVFWNVTLSDWSSGGCRTNPNAGDTITCHCDHLTNFAVLMYPKTNVLRESVESVLYIVTYIGCSTSVFCLVVTLITLMGAKEIRRRVPQKIMINLCVSLLCLYVVFILGVDSAMPTSQSCKAVAVLLHYFLLTSIAWTSVEAVNMYYSFVKVFVVPGDKFLWVAGCLAWGTPLLMVIVLAVATTDFYNNSTYCYINTSVGKFLFIFVLAPIALVAFCNSIIFVIVIRKLFLQPTMHGKIAVKSRRTKTKRVQNAVAILLLLGLTWIFGFLSFANKLQLPFLILFCFFNSFQGVAIFYLFCLRQSECRAVWRSWFDRLRNKGEVYSFYKNSGTRKSQATGNDVSLSVIPV